MGSAKMSTIQKPLSEHVSELRHHFTWIAVFVVAGAIVAYVYQDLLLRMLQQPLGETLYYTSPTGELSFIFKLCIVAGIIFALPAVLYNIFRFVEPVLEDDQRKGLMKYIVWSFILAYCGIAFAYFISLPSALQFLTNLSNGNIEALIGATEYFNFALAYVGGFAFLFQLPLVILFINRIKPLKPSGMMKVQKYVILGSYIVAAILTPTPDPLNQTMMAVPIIVLYQVSIVMILFVNRERRSAKRAAKKNTTVYFERQFAEEAAEAFPQVAHVVSSIVEPVAAPQFSTQPATTTAVSPKIAKPNRYFSDIAPVKRSSSYVSHARVTARRPIPTLTNQRTMVGNDFC